MNTTDRIPWEKALLAALVLAVIISVGVVGATSSTAFGPYNPNWDGASDFRSAVDADRDTTLHYSDTVEGYGELPTDRSVAFVIAPEDSYSPEEAEQIAGFVAEGGTLVVMDNFGQHSNALLEDLGAESRLDGRILRDEREYEGAPVLPVAGNISDHPFTSDVEQLSLNYASAIDAGNADVLVASSEYGYLVADPDRRIDDEDQLASYPVVTLESIEDGEIVTVADPSLVINVMYDEPDNAQFLKNTWNESDHVLIDLSKGENVPPLAMALFTLRGSSILQAIVGLVGIVLVAGVPRAEASIGRIQKRNEGIEIDISDDDRMAYLRNEYPEWDEERISRVIGALNHADKERRDR